MLVYVCVKESKFFISVYFCHRVLWQYVRILKIAQEKFQNIYRNINTYIHTYMCNTSIGEGL